MTCPLNQRSMQALEGTERGHLTLGVGKQCVEAAD